nr:MAG TPA: hypothetical protein [Caudoviricetes sp.]
MSSWGSLCMSALSQYLRLSLTYNNKKTTA